MQIKQDLVRRWGGRAFALALGLFGAAALAQESGPPVIFDVGALGAARWDKPLAAADLTSDQVPSLPGEFVKGIRSKDGSLAYVAATSFEVAAGGAVPTIPRIIFSPEQFESFHPESFFQRILEVTLPGGKKVQLLNTLVSARGTGMAFAPEGKVKTVYQQLTAFLLPQAGKTPALSAVRTVWSVSACFRGRKEAAGDQEDFLRWAQGVLNDTSGYDWLSADLFIASQPAAKASDAKTSPSGDPAAVSPDHSAPLEKPAPPSATADSSLASPTSRPSVAASAPRSAKGPKSPPLAGNPAGPDVGAADSRLEVSADSAVSPKEKAANAGNGGDQGGAPDIEPLVQRIRGVVDRCLEGKTAAPGPGSLSGSFLDGVLAAPAHGENPSEPEIVAAWNEIDRAANRLEKTEALSRFLANGIRCGKGQAVRVVLASAARDRLTMENLNSDQLALTLAALKPGYQFPLHAREDAEAFFHFNRVEFHERVGAWFKKQGNRLIPLEKKARRGVSGLWTPLQRQELWGLYTSEAYTPYEALYVWQNKLWTLDPVEPADPSRGFLIREVDNVVPLLAVKPHEKPKKKEKEKEKKEEAS